MKIHNMIKTNAMRKYRKVLSITLASLLLAATFPVNGGTSLAKSAPATLGEADQFNPSSPLPLPFPFPFNGALSASAFPTMAAAAGSDFQYLIRTCQRFGTTDPGGTCTFRGRRLSLDFDLPSNLAQGTAHIMFQTSGVSNSCNRLAINGTEIGIPNRASSNQSVSEYADIPTGVLRPGQLANTLLIMPANNSNCTFEGVVDDFLLNHLVIFYHVQ